MPLPNRPYIGTWKLNNQQLVQHTPDATPLTSVVHSCYSVGMRTPEQRQTWFQNRAANKPAGVCSRYPNCTQLTDGVHKLCSKHLMRALSGKKALKQRVKVPNECRVLECHNPARPGLSRCEGCAAKEARLAAQPHWKQRRAERRQEIRAEVVTAYGGACTCCGEARLAFLTIDHENRYNGEGPHTGTPLYLWLKAQSFPAGFRVLCQNCNFALGLFGYCPHGDLVQPLPERPVSAQTLRTQVKSRERNLKNKLDAFNAYGGVRCQCCQETHHECLTIDHLDNKGGDHRRALAGKPIYRWLAQEGYPEGFQVLCLNCNFAKRFHQVCPHKASPDGGG